VGNCEVEKQGSWVPAAKLTLRKGLIREMIKRIFVLWFVRSIAMQATFNIPDKIVRRYTIDVQVDGGRFVEARVSRTLGHPAPKNENEHKH